MDPASTEPSNENREVERKLNGWEARVVHDLISTLFQASNRSTPSTDIFTAESLDSGLSVALHLQEEFTTGSQMTIPVEGEVLDQAGGAVSILLHCRGGVPNELEVFRGDGELVQGVPDPDAIKYFVNDVTCA